MLDFFTFMFCATAGYFIVLGIVIATKKIWHYFFPFE